MSDNPFYRDVMRNIDEALRSPKIRTQVETECARCGEPMCVVRWLRKVSAEPDTEPLCERCTDEILHDREEYRDDEQPGSRCTGAGCGWCGRCS